MPVEYGPFGGIGPRWHAEALPPGMAVRAHQCLVRGGVLRPFEVSGPQDALHENGIMLSGVPSADVVEFKNVGDADAYGRPPKVTVASRRWLANPLEWLTILAYDFVSWSDGQSYAISLSRSQIMPITNIERTEQGFTITALLFQYAYTMTHVGGYTYNIKGPFYQFGLAMDEGGVNGGPETDVIQPDYLNEGAPIFSAQPVALFDTEGRVYAHFEVQDVESPSWADINNGTWTPEGAATTVYLPGYLPYQEVRFRINMNYAVPTRRTYYYVMTRLGPPLAPVDGAELTEFGVEGPPSKPSEQVLVLPGERVTLSTPRSAQYAVRLYRSTAAAEKGFRLLADYEADSVEDNTIDAAVQRVEVPPYGDFPGGSKDVVLRNSLLHPAHFGVIFVGKTVWMSDIFRLHAWPQEYTVSFQEDIIGIALTGNTILVFGGEKVYAVSGGNPAYMQRRELSSTAPLLNPLGLCRIGDTVFWPSRDGLAACGGGQVEIVSAPAFTRREWTWFNPATMSARVADRLVLLETGEAPPAPPSGASAGFLLEMGSTVYRPGAAVDESMVNLCFDTESGQWTTYLGTAPEVATEPLIWRGKQEWSTQRERYEWARVDADAYPVTIRPVANGNESPPEITVGDAGAVELVDSAGAWIPWARDWQFEVESSALVRRLSFFPRQTIPVAGATGPPSVRLTPETVQLLRAAWLKFEDVGRFCAGRLSCSQSGLVTVALYPDSAPTEPIEIETSNGEVFQVPRTMQKAAGCRVDIQTDLHWDELLLWQRRRVQVQGSLEVARQGDGLAPWLVSTYCFGDGRLQGLSVHAEHPVSMRLYYEGSATVSETVAIEGRGQVLLDQKIRDLEFDFSGQDADVLAVTITGGAPRTVDGPVHLQGDGLVVRGLLLKFADHGTWAAISVGCDAYPVEASFWAGGAVDELTEVDTYDLDDGYPFILARDLGNHGLWRLDLDAPDAVWEVLLYPRRAVVWNGPHILETRARGPVVPWLGKVYTFETPNILRSFLVDAASAVTAYVYLDDGEEPFRTIPMQPGIEVALDNAWPVCSRVEVNFGGDDHLVHRLALLGEEVRQVGQEGTVWQGRPGYRRLMNRREAPGAWRAVNIEGVGTVNWQMLVDGVLVSSGTGTGLQRVPRVAARTGKVLEVDIWEG